MNLPPPPPPKTDPARPGSPATRELPLLQPAETASSGTTQVLPPPVQPTGPVPGQPTGPAPAGPAAPVAGHPSEPLAFQPTGPVPFQATGPVDALPDPPAPPVPAGGGATRVTRRPRDRTALAGLGLGVAAVLLVEVGLLLGFGGAARLWTTVPLWSGFATLAVLLTLPAFLLGSGAAAGRAGRVALAGATGLAVFWLLVVLPVADTDRGFVLTAALACLGIGLWIAPPHRG